MNEAGSGVTVAGSNVPVPPNMVAPPEWPNRIRLRIGVRPSLAALAMSASMSPVLAVMPG